MAGFRKPGSIGVLVLSAILLLGAQQLFGLPQELPRGASTKRTLCRAQALQERPAESPPKVPSQDDFQLQVSHFQLLQGRDIALSATVHSSANAKSTEQAPIVAVLAYARDRRFVIEKFFRTGPQISVREISEQDLKEQWSRFGEPIDAEPTTSLQGLVDIAKSSDLISTLRDETANANAADKPSEDSFEIGFPGQALGVSAAIVLGLLLLTQTQTASNPAPATVRTPSTVSATTVPKEARIAPIVSASPSPSSASIVADWEASTREIIERARKASKATVPGEASSQPLASKLVAPITGKQAEKELDELMDQFIREKKSEIAAGGEKKSLNALIDEFTDFTNSQLNAEMQRISSMQ